MHPLLTFASGLLAGIVGVRLLNKTAPQVAAAVRAGDLGGKARQGLTQAQSGLRHATVSGLAAIEKSSASLRARLTPAQAEAEAEAEAEAAPATPAKPRRARKAPAKKAKPAAGPAEGDGSP